jgi:hypothetical protein
VREGVSRQKITHPVKKREIFLPSAQYGVVTPQQLVRKIIKTIDKITVMPYYVFIFHEHLKRFKSFACEGPGKKAGVGPPAISL